MECEEECFLDGLGLGLALETALEPEPLVESDEEPDDGCFLDVPAVPEVVEVCEEEDFFFFLDDVEEVAEEVVEDWFLRKASFF